jgi:hypothetical protein
MSAELASYQQVSHLAIHLQVQRLELKVPIKITRSKIPSKRVEWPHRTCPPPPPNPCSPTPPTCYVAHVTMFCFHFQIRRYTDTQ